MIRKSGLTEVIDDHVLQLGHIRWQKIRMVFFLEAVIRQRVMMGRFDAVQREAVFDTVQVTAIEGNDLTPRLCFLDQRFDAAADTGNTGHFGNVVTVQFDRQPICQLTILRPRPLFPGERQLLQGECQPGGPKLYRSLSGNQ